MGIKKTSIFLANRKWQVTLLVLALGIFYLSGIGPYLDTNGDNAHYIILAKSLVTGQGFRSIHLPDKPLHTTYGFVFPLFISPLVFLEADNYFQLKFVPLIFALGAMAISYYLFKEQTGHKLALTIVLLSGTSPLLFTYSHRIMSETCYLFFSLICLYWLKDILFVTGIKTERNTNTSLTTGQAIAAGLTMAVAYLTRAIGLSLAISISVFVVFIVTTKIKSERVLLKRLCLILLIFILLISPWQIRNILCQDKNPADTPYWQQLLMKNPYAPEAGLLTVKDLFVRVRSNFLYYLHIIPQSLFFTPLVYPLTIALGLLALLLSLTGMANKAKRGISVLEIYTVLYMGICLTWPWHGERFILPIVPFFYYYLLDGIRTVLNPVYLPRKNTKCHLAILITAIILVVLLTFNIIIDLQIARKETGPLYYPAEWKNYYYLALWVKENIPAKAIVMCRKPCLFYLWSQHKSTTFLLTKNSEKLIKQIQDQGVDYIVLDAFTWTRTTEIYLKPALVKYQSMFKTICVIPEPNTYLLKVKSSSIIRNFSGNEGIK